VDQEGRAKWPVILCGLVDCDVHVHRGDGWSQFATAQGQSGHGQPIDPESEDGHRKRPHHSKKPIISSNCQFVKNAIRTVR